MASRIYEYACSVNKILCFEETKKDYSSSVNAPVIAKGNIYQGILAQW